MPTIVGMTVYLQKFSAQQVHAQVKGSNAFTGRLLYGKATAYSLCGIVYHIALTTLYTTQFWRQTGRNEFCRHYYLIQANVIALAISILGIGLKEYAEQIPERILARANRQLTTLLEEAKKDYQNHVARVQKAKVANIGPHETPRLDAFEKITRRRGVKLNLLTIVKENDWKKEADPTNKFSLYQAISTAINERKYKLKNKARSTPITKEQYDRYLVTKGEKGVKKNLDALDAFYWNEARKIQQTHPKKFNGETAALHCSKIRNELNLKLKQLQHRLENAADKDRFYYHNFLRESQNLYIAAEKTLKARLHEKGWWRNMIYPLMQKIPVVAILANWWDRWYDPVVL